MLKKILVGLDGSKGSFKALEEGLLLVTLAGTELHTISVEEVPRFPGTIGEVVEEKEAQDTRFGVAIAQAQKMAEERRVKLCPHVVIGHEVKSIVEFIKEHGYDLLILGFMGHSAVYDRLMGGTCQNIVRVAPCAVLVVK
ncbi:MAG: universal stress protein [Deltaproteobacteria bacterium]|nr:universal stress protein [Deltaproteobacteria bacterium]